MRSSPAPHRLASLLVGLSLVAAAGCGPSTGSLSGKVTYQGAPLKGGTVTLIPTGSGPTFSAKIQEDGTYTIDPIRSGKYKVCVETTSLRPGGAKAGPVYGGRTPGGMDKSKSKIKNEPPKGAQLPEGYRMAEAFGGGSAESAKRYVQIPAEFSSPETTSLTVDVKGGAQQHDIPLG